MLTLLTIILGGLTFLFRKSDKIIMKKLFILILIIIGMFTWGFWIVYISKIYTSPDLNNCRQKQRVAQEEIQKLKKESNKKDSLDEETVNQFLEYYSKAENEAEFYAYLIEENEYYLEGGGKEKIEFWLFFNLF